MSVNFRLSTASKATLAILLGAALASCGGEGNSTPGTSVNNPAPAPAPAPTQYVETEVPFGLTSNTTFAVFGWDDWWLEGPIASTIEMRWNSAEKQYELRTNSGASWNRLQRIAGEDFIYDVFEPDGAMAEYNARLYAWTASHQFATKYVGTVALFDYPSAISYVAFGIPTATADMPTSGTRTCIFGEDEVGGGEVTINFATGNIMGTVEPFYGTDVYDLEGAVLKTTGFTADFGTDTGNTFEAKFFGPDAANIAVRAQGQVAGIMTGVCEA
ncbi:hypothetical protein [Sphingomicrobium nitratireducens]|uniref:hypothetical protein n=1 Tax=Sphingomicrobium nitratireducens TaxID=2964666 RepID=UPI00223FC92F|nr:hypothetical protein [Sphingomicrobium nitratireducens]